MIQLLKAPIELRNGYKDKEHLAKLHDIPCVVCNKFHLKQTSRTVAHHFIGMGLGKKASDLLTLSLCEYHHTGTREEGCKDAIHSISISLKAWEEKFGTQKELLEEVKELLK